MWTAGFGGLARVTVLAPVGKGGMGTWTAGFGGASRRGGVGAGRQGGGFGGRVRATDGGGRGAATDFGAGLGPVASGVGAAGETVLAICGAGSVGLRHHQRNRGKKLLDGRRQLRGRTPTSGECRSRFHIMGFTLKFLL